MLAHTWHEVGSNNWSNRIKKENCHGGFSTPPEENKCCRAKHRRERMRLIGTPELKVRLCHISVQLLSAVFATTAPCVSNTVISSRTREDRVYLGGGCRRTRHVCESHQTLFSNACTWCVNDELWVAACVLTVMATPQLSNCTWSREPFCVWCCW